MPILTRTLPAALMSLALLAGCGDSTSPSTSVEFQLSKSVMTVPAPGQAPIAFDLTVYNGTSAPITLPTCLYAADNPFPNVVIEQMGDGAQWSVVADYGCPEALGNGLPAVGAGGKLPLVRMVPPGAGTFRYSVLYRTEDDSLHHAISSNLTVLPTP